MSSNNGNSIINKLVFIAPLIAALGAFMVAICGQDGLVGEGCFNFGNTSGTEVETKNNTVPSNSGSDGKDEDAGNSEGVHTSGTKVETKNDPVPLNSQITGNGGTTGWNSTSSTSEQTCMQEAIQTMNILVDRGEIQTLPNASRNSSRFRKGNNVIFDVVCTKSGYVRVDIICFNACERPIFTLRDKIDALMEW